MWTEGLISAAKAVAESTRNLVQAASKAARGEIDDAALIAAARAVAASTAQLVTATRAKSEPGAPGQQALDQAAAAVTRATKALVDSAKSYRSQEELAMLRKTDSFASSVRAEIEQQAEILRLEQQLELQRKRLFAMRKDKYTDAHEAQAQAAVSPRVAAPTSPAQPRARAADIDTSSTVTGFGKKEVDAPMHTTSTSTSAPAPAKAYGSGSGNQDDDDDVPAYMKKLSSPRTKAAPPDPKSIPKFWQHKDQSPAHAPAPAAPTPVAAPVPAPAAAPAPAPAPAPAAVVSEWNPFAAPAPAPPTASNPFGNAPATQMSHNPFL